MGFHQADRTRQVCTSTGLGNFVLGSTATGDLPLSGSYVTGDTFYYTADAGNGQWEIGEGTYTSAGQVARTTCYKSSGGTAFVNFTSAPTLWIDLPASKAVTVDPNGNTTIPGHATIEGATTTGATGTGNLVLAASPTFTGTFFGANGTLSGTMQAAALVSTGGLTLGGSITGATTINASGQITAASLALSGAITGATTGAFSGVITSASSQNSEYDGLVITNANSGSSAIAAININNGTYGAELSMFGTSHSAGGANFASGAQLSSSGPGGFSYIASGSGGNAIHRFYIGASTSYAFRITGTDFSGPGVSCNLDVGSGGSLAITGFGNSVLLNAGGFQYSNGSGFQIVNGSSVGVLLQNGTTSWIAASDETLKTAFAPFINAVAKVSSIKVGTGRYLTDDESVSRSFVSAQSVQKVLPEAVSAMKDGKLGVRYTELIPLLIAAIKELSDEIQTLKASTP